MKTCPPIHGEDLSRYRDTTSLTRCLLLFSMLQEAFVIIDGSLIHGIANKVTIKI